MDGPTWWNNRLWRSSSMREERPSSATSQRLNMGYNGFTQSPSATTTQTQAALNVYPGQTSTYTIPPRQREKKLIRPNFRPSTPKREGGRPLAAMRINFFNGITHNDEFAYNNAPVTRSGTPSNSMNRTTNNPPSVSSVVYGRSLTPSPMSNYTVYNRPNSVAVVYPKPQASMINSTLSITSPHSHDADLMSTSHNENYHSLQNVSLMTSQHSAMTHPFRTTSSRPPPSNSHPVTFVRNGTHPVDNSPSVTSSLSHPVSSQEVGGTPSTTSAFSSAPLLQSRNNVIASRFGRRVLRPNVTFISSDGDDAEAEASSDTQHKDTPKKLVDESKPPISHSLSPTSSSKPPLPSSSAPSSKSANISSPSNTPAGPGSNTDLPNSTTSSPTSSNSIAFIRGNLWQGNTKLKELILVPSQNGKADSKPPQIQETYPVRTPLKSILKKSNSFISGLPQHHVESYASNHSLHFHEDDHKTDPIQVAGKHVGSQPTLTPNHISKENLPQNGGTPTNGMSEERGMHQSILLRRSLQSAPSLKRAVRFNMGQNAVLEFHATENHFSNDDSDYL